MNITDKELRKMLNAAWDECCYRHYAFRIRFSMEEYWKRRRYRDVSRIIKETKKKKEVTND